MTFPSVLFCFIFFFFKEGAGGCWLAFPPSDEISASACIKKEELNSDSLLMDKLKRAELQMQVFILLSGVFLQLPGDKGSPVIVLHKCCIVLCSVCSGQLFFPLVLLSFPQILCLKTQTWTCVSWCARSDIVMSAEAVGRRPAVAAGGGSCGTASVIALCSSTDAETEHEMGCSVSTEPG